MKYPGNAPRARLEPHFLVATHSLGCWFLLHAGHRVFADGVAQTALILIYHWHRDFVRFVVCTCVRDVVLFRFECVISASASDCLPHHSR